MAEATPISISTLDVQKIANLYQIMDDINQSFARIQNDVGERVAEILKNVIRATIGDPGLDENICSLIIRTIRTLTHQADLSPAERQLGVVRGALTYISMLLPVHPSILDYFQLHLDDLREFFGISE